MGQSPHESGQAGGIRGRVELRGIREALRSVDPGDSGAVAEILDPLAREAAAGSFDAIELAVWAVDELRLARPAIRRLLVDDADVDEVAQDVLVAVAETIGGYRGDARFTTWLYQVARFKAIAHLRRTRPTAALPDEVPPPGGGTGRPGTAAAGIEGDARRISSIIATRASVQEILDTLPPLYRTPVVLRDLEQLSYDEVAMRLDTNVNTAKTRVARGRALVAARLAS